MENKNTRGRQEIYGIEMCRGSIYPTEAEEWMHQVRECFEIINCEEDIKVKLFECILLVNQESGGLRWRRT